MSKLRKVAFTAVSDTHYYPEGTHIFINSFKRFHPDIDLVVFRQDVVDKLFKLKDINWYQAKPFFAELLMDQYDLVVNMDADHVITGRLAEIFDNVDYDVAMPWNYNLYENASFENITEKMYLQAGIVASTKKEFWMEWQKANRDAMKYPRKENDIVNLLIYNGMPYLKLKILDEKKDYYGCKSLGQELRFRVENDQLMLNGERVLAYHFARGGVFPKLDFLNMPFRDEVKQWLIGLAYGQSFKMVGV